MGKIKILEDRIIDRIAAGEIVERAASVVKELIENSIDAAATSIDIEVQDGGKERIRVDDNGEGMDKEDICLAFERHATSKISKEDDLFSISTMGFRGEALPSIASVSRMTIRSGTDLLRPGNKVSAHGGKIIKMSEVAPCKGTMVDVQSLFFNTPARKKFLKSSQTELSHIIEGVQHFALSFHQLRFTLTSGQREILNLPPVMNKRERVSQLFGPSLPDALIPISFSSGPMSIEGYISKASVSRKSRSAQHLFINGRFIKDRIIASAALNAYRDFYKENHPYLLLFLQYDPSLVDFNVHPAKLEVRFKDSNDVYLKVREAIASALSMRGFSHPAYISPESTRAEQRLSEVEAKEIGVQSAPKEGKVDERIPLNFPEPALVKAGWRIIGQHLDIYIIASRHEELYIIDQHIAHERVLYEDLLQSARKNRIEKQKLMFPLTVSLSPSEASWIETNRELLSLAGLSVENFGTGMVKIEEIPAHLRVDSAAELVKEIASAGSHAQILEGDEGLSRMVAALACHSAVKAGEKLAPAKMEFIVESLFACSNPHVCPHGRPIFLHLGQHEFMKHFKRRS